MYSDLWIAEHATRTYTETDALLADMDVTPRAAKRAGNYYDLATLISQLITLDLTAIIRETERPS